MAGRPKAIETARVGSLNINEKSKCPECKKSHPRNRDKTFSDRFTSCPVFRAKDVEERVTMLRTHSACYSCTSWKHPKKDCKLDFKCKYKEDGTECGGEHHAMIHGTTQVISAHLLLEDPLSHIIGCGT